MILDARLAHTHAQELSDSDLMMMMSAHDDKVGYAKKKAACRIRGGPSTRF
jgi:hypothetical protein